MSCQVLKIARQDFVVPQLLALCQVNLDEVLKGDRTHLSLLRMGGGGGGALKT